MDKAVRLNIDKDGIAEAVFDMPGMKVNLLTAEVMKEFVILMAELEGNRSIKALAFKSAKPGVFIAGADIKEIYGIKSADEAEIMAKMGQDIIGRIERLKFPTICMISGACLGGGLELALACSYRVLSLDPKTQLGLPETTLGLMPGFGGSYRLPRLVGIARGLGMILTGRSAGAAEALRTGLADACYPEAFLMDKTREFIVKKVLSGKTKDILRMRKKRRGGFLLEGNPLGRALVFQRAKKDLLKKTRGFYPAPMEALKVIRKSYGSGIEKSLALERKAFSKLAVSDSSKKLMEIYFLNEELKKAYTAPRPVSDKLKKSGINSAGLLGAGKMGGGIAWLFSNSGIPIRMKDMSWDYIAAGYRAVKEIYSESVRRHKLEIRESSLRMHKISGAVDFSGFGNADVVIEAIVEDKEEKIKALSELEKHIREDAIIATNTSSYSLAELSAGLKHPGRFVGFHFFNPVNRMPLIEVVRGPESSDLAVYSMIMLARKLKKTPVLLNDANGFLVNRVLMAYLNEAVSMAEEGADFVKIDETVYESGMPMGPFTLLDEIGLQTGIKVSKILSGAYPGRSAESVLLPAIGELKDLKGKSSGRGFFIYGKGGKRPNPILRDIIKRSGSGRTVQISKKEIVERCFLRMINEAAFCLGEKIIDKAGFLDMALIMGIGYPPFTGGLLRKADKAGIDNICARLRDYEKKYGRRFEPAPYLADLEKNKGRFYQ